MHLIAELLDIEIPPLFARRTRMVLLVILSYAALC